MGDRLIGGLAVRERGDPAEGGILLWPGLGATGAYFASVDAALPGRTVAVDPPGSGGSVTLDPCTVDRLVDIARDVAEVCGCYAIVGHSLGAYVAAAVAAYPTAGVRAAVLIDGGFLDAEGFAELGMPTTAGRDQLAAWMEANSPRFPDWDTALRELADMVGADPTPRLEAYVREVFSEVGGQIRERARPDGMADLLLAVLDQDVCARAQRVRIPTMLIVCGQPPEYRPFREQAWQRFVAASPLIELHVAEGWGHNPILQNPEESSSLIADWLRVHR